MREQRQFLEFAVNKLRRLSTSYVLGILLVTAATTGCDSGPKLVQGGGTVNFKNKPVSGADVVFVPDAGGAPVIGRSDDEGKFTLTSDGQSGALAGSYKVAVTAVRQLRPVKESEAVGMTDAQIAANHESLVPIKYNNTISSGLTATVTDDPSANQFTLDLK